MPSERQTEVLRAQLLSKAVLHPDETELYELTQLAGVTMDPNVFKIILDLLKLNVPPVAIIQTLRSMCSPHHHHHHDLKTIPAVHRHEAHPNVTAGRGDTSHDTSSLRNETHSNVTVGRGDTSQDSSRHHRGSRTTSSSSSSRKTYKSSKW